jgi:hypothetical protein
MVVAVGVVADKTAAGNVDVEIEVVVTGCPIGKARIIAFASVGLVCSPSSLMIVEPSVPKITKVGVPFTPYSLNTASDESYVYVQLDL